jgi:hypothetical protein
MPNFQGTGFNIELPEDCTDASTYTFVLPENNGFSATLNIRHESATEVKNLKAHINVSLKALRDSVTNFTLLNQAAGKRGEHEGLMTSFEWGEGPGRVRQKQYCLMTSGENPKIYILTSTDLVSNAAQSDRVFNSIMKSFVPLAGP